MCKKLIPSLLLMGCSIAAFAQPTLTEANSAPQIWNSFLNIICDTAGVTQGASGAGVTWDFTAPPIVAVTVDTGSAYPCTATPHCSLFSGATYGVVSHATDVVPYFSESASSLSQVGFYESADTYAVTTPLYVMGYPFTYLSSINGSYSGTLYYGSAHAAQTGVDTATADGYGTLILPGIPGVLSATTYSNVLRIHTVQTYTDNLSVFGLPDASFKLESYTWYMPNYHSALMTILYTTETDGIGSYRNKAVSISPAQIDVATHNIQPIAASLNIFPNPASDELNIRYTTANDEHVRISLVDLIGREIAVIADRYTLGDQNISYNTNNIPKGLYLIHFQSGTETITRKIEVQ